MKDNLPDFLCIGVQRGATTWLHQCLAEHPEVFVPKNRKEIEFFSKYRDSGVEWYRSHFTPISSNHIRAKGELTPAYLHEADFAFMHGVVPDVKLLVILREPISRAISAYELLSDSFPGESFEETAVYTRYFIDMSLYHERLKKLLGIYPREQLLVMTYDEVCRDSRLVFQTVCDFIGVDSGFCPPSLGRRVNQVVFPNLQKAVGQTGAKWIGSFVRSNRFLETFVRDLGGRKTNPSFLGSKGFRNKLADLFDADVESVGKLLDMDLIAWRRAIERFR
jgi:hypothetical protein